MARAAVPGQSNPDAPEAAKPEHTMTDLVIALRRATAAGCQVRLYATLAGEVRVNVVRRRAKSPVHRYESAQSPTLRDRFDDVDLARAIVATHMQLEADAWPAELVYDTSDHLLRRA